MYLCFISLCFYVVNVIVGRAYTHVFICDFIFGNTTIQVCSINTITVNTTNTIISTELKQKKAVGLPHFYDSKIAARDKKMKK